MTEKKDPIGGVRCPKCDNAFWAKKGDAYECQKCGAPFSIGTLLNPTPRMAHYTNLNLASLAQVQVSPPAGCPHCGETRLKARERAQGGLEPVCAGCGKNPGEYLHKLTTAQSLNLASRCTRCADDSFTVTLRGKKILSAICNGCGKDETPQREVNRRELAMIADILDNDTHWLFDVPGKMDEGEAQNRKKRIRDYVKSLQRMANE